MLRRPATCTVKPHTLAINPFAPTITLTLQPFLLVYGGDPAHPLPTIGTVVQQLQQQLGCHVLALQAAGKHEGWVDHVFV